MQNKKFILSYPFSLKMFLKVGGIIMFVLGIHFLNLANKQEYLQLMILVMGLGFSVFGFMCFAESYSTLLIDSEGIKQKNLVKEINLRKEDIEGFAEIPIKTSKKTSILLVIFGKDKRKSIKIDKGNHVEEYDLLIERLRKEYKRVGFEYRNLILKKRQKLGKLIGQGIGLIVLIIGVYQLLFVTEIPFEDFYEIKGQLKENPRIEEDRKGRVPSMIFEMTIHQNIKFRATGKSFRMLHQNAHNLKKKDNVSLLILNSDYRQQINKVEIPSLEKRYINWNIIEIYGLSTKNQILLDYKQINKSKSELTFKLFLILTGLGTLLYYRFISKGTY